MELMLPFLSVQAKISLLLVMVVPENMVLLWVYVVGHTPLTSVYKQYYNNIKDGLTLHSRVLNTVICCLHKVKTNIPLQLLPI